MRVVPRRTPNKSTHVKILGKNIRGYRNRLRSCLFVSRLSHPNSSSSKASGSAGARRDYAKPWLTNASAAAGGGHGED